MLPSDSISTLQLRVYDQPDSHFDPSEVYGRESAREATG